MEYPELFESVSNLWSTFISADGFAWFGGFLFLAGFVFGIFCCLLIVILGDVFEMLHEAVPLVRRFIDDRKAKKSGKLTNEQRLELLEEKIDSLANIVISSSEEVK